MICRPHFVVDFVCGVDQPFLHRHMYVLYRVVTPGTAIRHYVPTLTQLRTTSSQSECDKYVHTYNYICLFSPQRLAFAKVIDIVIIAKDEVKNKSHSLLPY